MKLSSLALTLALIPAAFFSTSTAAPTVIPGGSFTSTYVISAPGSYVLGGNRSASTGMFVIKITAPDVTLDLAGFRLSNPTPNTSGPAGATIHGGIYVPTPENVEIRNGSIVDAGNYGINAGNGIGVRVVDVRVASTKYAGIHITAGSSQVVRCQAVDPGHQGISAWGDGALVSDCVVSGAATTGVSVAKGGLIVRTVARGCAAGFNMWTAATAIDCMASGGTVGFHLNAGCALRGIESINNTEGVAAWSLNSVITGSRIMNNTTNITGNNLYTNGGGNVIIP